METVLDVLKAMEKATAREIAARMKIEPAAMLAMLREHDERGEVTQTNGYWLAVTETNKPKAAPKKPAVQPPARASVSDLMALLVEHGPKTADELAKLAGIASKKVAPALTHHMSKGRILREKVNNKFVYSVKAEKSAEARSEITESPEATPAAPVKSVTEIVREIPAFISRPDDLVIPSARFISNEIRRTKAKLASLENLRAAVRSIRKHGALMQELRDEAV